MQHWIIATPYIIFWQQKNSIFCLAVVSGGLFMSYRSHEIFRRGRHAWICCGYGTNTDFHHEYNGFCPDRIRIAWYCQWFRWLFHCWWNQTWTAHRAITIILRYLVFPAAHIPVAEPRARQEPSPGWKGPVVISWAGMRGVVSLATALSIPINDKWHHVPSTQYHHIYHICRHLYYTLVFQGITLPYLIKFIRLRRDRRFDSWRRTAGRDTNPPQPGSHCQWKISGTKDKMNWFNSIHLSSKAISQVFNSSFLQWNVKIPAEKKLFNHHKMLKEIYLFQRKELFRLRKEVSTWWRNQKSRNAAGHKWFKISEAAHWYEYRKSLPSEAFPSMQATCH